MGVNWKGILGGAAPVIARALGGPASVAAPALTALSKLLLGKDGAPEGDVAAAIAGATPEQLQKLRELDQEYALKFAEVAVQIERIEADDRANARHREIDTHDWTPRLIGLSVMLAFFILLGMLLTFEIPAKNERPFDLLLGMLGGSVTTVLAYYFGTSSSSRAKDAVIGRIARGS